MVSVDMLQDAFSTKARLLISADESHGSVLVVETRVSDQVLRPEAPLLTLFLSLLIDVFEVLLNSSYYFDIDEVSDLLRLLVLGLRLLQERVD